MKRNKNETEENSKNLITEQDESKQQNSSVNDKITNEQLDAFILENNIAKIAYTLDKDYLSHLEEYETFEFNEYCKLKSIDYKEGQSKNLNLIKITDFIINKDEKVIDCMKNVIGSFSNTSNSLGFLIRRKKDCVDIFFVFKKDGKIAREEVKNKIELLEKGIKGNFPGTKLEKIEIDSDVNKQIEYLNDIKFISMLSSIPSDKSEDFISQGIDKLLNGFVPTKSEDEYTVLILAESISEEGIRDIINGFEEMATAITPYASHQFQIGNNESESTGEMKSVTDTTGISHAISKTHSVNIGINAGGSNTSTKGSSSSKTKGKSTTHSGSAIGGIIGGVIGSIIPAIGTTIGAGIGSIIGSLIGNKTSSSSKTKGIFESLSKTLSLGISGGYGYSWGKIDTNSESKALTDGTNHNITLGTNETNIYNYKSYQVTDLLQLLENNIKRLTESKSTGLWKTATYVFSNDSTTSESVANYLKGLSQGDESYIESAKTYTWKRPSDNNDPDFENVKNYLTHFIHPIFENKNEKKLLNEMKNKIEDRKETPINEEERNLITESLQEIEKNLIKITPTTNISTTELAKIFSLPSHSLPGLPVLECAEFGRNISTYDNYDINSEKISEVINNQKDTYKTAEDNKKREKDIDKIYKKIKTLEEEKSNIGNKESQNEINKINEQIKEKKSELNDIMDQIRSEIETDICTKSAENFPSDNMSKILNKDRKVKLGAVFHMHQEENQPINLNLNSLASHTFITGSTGSGKSNTIYQILSEIKKSCIYKYDEKGNKINKENKVNFLVIEPAKGEYKNVFGQDESKNVCDVHVYGTNPSISNLLRINPFSFPNGKDEVTKNIHILEHLDRLVEIFNVCWPMYAAMPAVLKEAVEKSYEDCGWNLTESINEYGEDLYPTFTDVTRNIRTIIDSSEYDAENKGAYKGALITRLKSLSNGINGLVFTSDELSNEDLFEKNVIVDLSRVGSAETKSLIMGLLVLKLQEYRMTTGGGNKDFQHVTVLEEAHNLLKRTSTEQSQDSGNLLGKSVEMLTNAIAEMRTYGEGFIIADQAPGLLDMAVIRNTNTKIIMRLPDLGDRQLVGKAANLNDNQIDELAKLPTGVAAVYQNNWVQPVLCKVDHYKDGNRGNFKPKLNETHEISLNDRIDLVKKICFQLSEINENDEKLLKKVSGVTFSSYKQYEDSQKIKPNYDKLSYIVSSLLPEFTKTLKDSALKNPSKVELWRNDVQKHIEKELRENNQFEIELRNSILQCVLQNYILGELNKPSLLNELLNRKVQ